MKIPQWLQRQTRITALVQEIRAMDTYYADKSNARVIEDALKAWKHTIATRDAKAAASEVEAELRVKPFGGPR